MATQAAPAPLLQVICFSMDRVFQLSEYLRTLHTHVCFRGVAMRDAFAPSFARVVVICRCTSAEIRAHYEAIERQYARHSVTFMYESETQSFADCLLRSIDNGGMVPRKVRDDDADSAEDAKSPYVMFNVDDAFYFDDVELADAFAFLDGEATSESAWPFAFHVKLAPSIWRSHLTNKPMLPLPPMQTVVRHKGDNYGGGIGDSSSSVVPFEMAYHVFDPSRGALDWNYLWELSGSVYLRETAERVVMEIQAQFGKKGINHPNHLELRGHQVVQQWTTGSTAPGNKKKRLQCACSLSPKMHVFAINQVQDVFNNRLYEDETDSLGGGGGGGDLTNLLRLYNANETLDESFYRRNRLSSVHIGTLVLKARATSSEVFSQVKMQELVSVVIPVFNVAKYVEQALRSIMNQTYEHLEILVVDDASTDATSEIIARLQTQDARIQHIRNATNLGVAASLNKGFALAKGAFVARMDGDDVSLPERIERQVHYLRENPQVAIVGASVLILREDENPDSRKDNLTKLETAVYPTSPLITKWRMLFGCFVGHPTVMLRREVLDILASGVAACSSDGEYYYSTSQTSSEDYELWLRCLYSHGLTVQSMGDALVIHRKHPRNVSKVRREQQISETQAIATKFIQSITSDSKSDGAEPSSHYVLPLFDVNTSDSVDDLSSSISVLQKLESEVCQSLKGASKATNDELDCEREYISQDAASREGELALKSMLLDPIRGTQLWSSFASKHPQVSRSAFEKLFKK